jgi:hypothetical protein
MHNHISVPILHVRGYFYLKYALGSLYRADVGSDTDVSETSVPPSSKKNVSFGAVESICCNHQARSHPVTASAAHTENRHSGL